jgi:hypothetical protein
VGVLVPVIQDGVLSSSQFVLNPFATADGLCAVFDHEQLRSAKNVAGNGRVEPSRAGGLDADPYRHNVYTLCLTGNSAFFAG